LEYLNFGGARNGGAPFLFLGCRRRIAVTRRFLLAGDEQGVAAAVASQASHCTAKCYAREFLHSWHESQRYMEERKEKPQP
jgi:hypothetical protein